MLDRRSVKLQCRALLDGEALAAAAGALAVGVVKYELGRDVVLDKVHLGADDVQQGLRVDKELQVRVGNLDDLKQAATGGWKWQPMRENGM